MLEGQNQFNGSQLLAISFFIYKISYSFLTIFKSFNADFDTVTYESTIIHIVSL
jgi:hypothetical protein